MNKKTKKEKGWEEKPTNYLLTREFIYENASKRIQNRINTLGVSRGDVLNSDPLLSNILNNKRTRNNPFLIPDYAFYFKPRKEIKIEGIEYGFLPVLKFRNHQEVLWGNDEEKNKNIEGFHWNLIFDLETTQAELIDKALCCYIPYSKLKAYKKLLADCDDREYALKYFLFDIKEFDNIPIVRKKAIEFLLLVPEYKEKFKKLIYELYEFNSFSGLNKKLETFVKEKFVPLLEDCFINNNTLGMRTKMIIEQDFITMEKLLCLCDRNINDVIKNDELKTQFLINKYSYDYIENLSFIQSQYCLEKTL